jgi:hypothetical protein
MTAEITCEGRVQDRVGYSIFLEAKIDHNGHSCFVRSFCKDRRREKGEKEEEEEEREEGFRE